MQELEKIPYSQRIYLDESGVNKYLYREYARGVIGHKIYGEISGKRFGRQSVISALFNNKFFSPMCFEGTCDTILFNTWLEKVLIPNLKPGQVLILDNASFHKSKKSKELVEKAGCKMLFLPPYSPDLNPIEKCWANMKNRMRELLPKLKNFIKSFYEAILSMQN